VVLLSYQAPAVLPRADPKEDKPREAPPSGPRWYPAIGIFGTIGTHSIGATAMTKPHGRFGELFRRCCELGCGRPLTSDPDYATVRASNWTPGEFEDATTQAGFSRSKASYYSYRQGRRQPPSADLASMMQLFGVDESQTFDSKKKRGAASEIWKQQKAAYEKLSAYVRYPELSRVDLADGAFQSIETVSGVTARPVLDSLLAPALAMAVEPEMAQRPLGPAMAAGRTGLDEVPCSLLPEIFEMDQENRQMADGARDSAAISVDWGIDGCIHLTSSYLYRGWAADEVKFSPLLKNSSPDLVPVPIIGSNVKLRMKKLPSDLERVCEVYAGGGTNLSQWELFEIFPYQQKHGFVELVTTPSSYFRYKPVQDVLREQLTDESGYQWKPLDKYSRTLLDFANSPLPYPLVCPVVVVLNRKDLLLIERPPRRQQGSQVDVEWSKWSCSFEERMTGPPQAHTDNKRYPPDWNPFETVRRGIEREVAGRVVVPDDDIRILSIAVEAANLFVNLFAIAHVDLTLERVKRLPASDKDAEGKRKATIEWTPEALAPALFRRPTEVSGHTIGPTQWHRTSRIRMLFSLYHRYGIRDTNERLLRWRQS